MRGTAKAFIHEDHEEPRSKAKEKDGRKQQEARSAVSGTS
jgi:hypothetical protein